MANKKKETTPVKVKKTTYKLNPDYDTLVVEEILKDRKTAGGIFIPDSVELDEAEDTRMGTIVAFGPASNPARPFLWKVGDVIGFGQYAGRAIQFTEKNLLILRHLDILVNVEEVN